MIGRFRDGGGGGSKVIRLALRLTLAALLLLSVAGVWWLTRSDSSTPPRPAIVEPVPPGEHPRLFFTRRDIPTLRKWAHSTHRDIWAPILAFARDRLDSAPPPVPASGDLDAYRNAGNQMIAFAFAYVITDDRGYLDLTRRHLLAYIDWEDWGDEGGYGDRDLGFHHMLLGNAIAYDWVHDGLSETERAAIAANLARRSQQSYDASRSVASRWSNWWRRTYTQNHHWTNHGALGMAALALEGEDRRWRSWLDLAADQMARNSFLAEGIGDGSWHEGVHYQSYGLTMSLPFFYNLRQLQERDIIPHTYLRNYVYWRLYNMLPGSGRFALTHANFEWDWGTAYGPEGILRFAAAEYRNGHAEWMARQLVAQGGRGSSVYSAPWYVFEFLYYDPTVGPGAPDYLPLARTFPDLEGVIWRTGWGEGDLVFALKTGAPAGRYAFDNFTGGRYPFDNPQQDRLSSGHDHDDANSFYLYRGSIDLASERAGYGLHETRYHNTLLVDGRGQYRTMAGGGGADRDPALFAGTDGRLEMVGGTPSFDYLVADATDAYRDQKAGVRALGERMLEEFRRYVLFVRPDYLVMVDRVRSGSPRQYDWISYFGSSVSVEGEWVKGGGGSGQILGVKVVGPREFVASTGGDGKRYVSIRPSSKVRNTSFVTVLYPTDEAGWRGKPSISSIGETDDACGVRVLLEGTHDHLFRYGRGDAASIGGYSFDGRVASIIRDPEGKLRRVFLAQGSRLSDSGGSRELVRSGSRVQAFEATYRGSTLEVAGDNLGGVAIYAPETDAGRVKVNDAPVPATRVGDYVVLPDR